MSARFSHEADFGGGLTLTVHPPFAGTEQGAHIHFYDPTHRGRERTILYPSDEQAVALAQALLPDGYTVSPPAGHEDEAAVERMAEVLYRARPTGGYDWHRAHPAIRGPVLALARAALAAARGPRTPDGPATN